ncbi:MAG: hypothetical protein IIA41_01580, partial [SAR324 cluster bacterium]|nr:hypothetical protein [SAR324 cluster bacterium]
MSQQDPQESAEATAQATGTNGASGGAAAGAAPQSGGWLANLRNRALSGIPALAIVLAVIALAPSFVLSLVVTAAGAVGIAEYQRLLPEPLRQRVRLELLVGAAVLIGLGGHVIKVGLGPLIADMIERGLVTDVVLNGSSAIHDLEIALHGQTSER